LVGWSLKTAHDQAEDDPEWKIELYRLRHPAARGLN